MEIASHAHRLASRNQTRLRLRGRQPLCGIGVTSRIDVTVKPAACSARNADSRPEPGPATSTSSVRIPCSCAFLETSSAATCAAYGVDLRDPLKPIVPADDQAMVLPCASVMVMVVLLNDEFTCAMPDAMFLRSRRRTRVAASLPIVSLSCDLNAAVMPAAPPASGERQSSDRNHYPLLPLAYRFRYFFLPAIDLAGPLRVRALVWVRWPRTGKPRR